MQAEFHVQCMQCAGCLPVCYSGCCAFAGNIVYYQKDPNYWQKVRSMMFGDKKTATA